MSVTQTEIKNTEERLDWLNQTVEIRKRQGRLEDSAYARYAARLVSDLFASNLFAAAKKTLDRAKVPYVPFLVLDKSRVTVR